MKFGPPPPKRLLEMCEKAPLKIKSLKQTSWKRPYKTHRLIVTASAIITASPKSNCVYASRGQATESTTGVSVIEVNSFACLLRDSVLFHLHMKSKYAVWDVSRLPELRAKTLWCGALEGYAFRH